ncbi:rap1 GTPase-GDP dissociation stimulator 1-like [Pelobates cultripes]|uniref:Rap1 GTPase-GDP dissociation stimulator 1-like n=1 Tax=Pelobates cultripes TaxID=61616 RepID=A0AAD1WT96_PELCU|nr:rap1 GTPase-GDP dissociation stimulator 1-like [Pelobates cultripes]CAH2321358.1 rap1 GTPase-GDP dissociation stimulator 1-like [Pelobates cultripes]
METLIHHLECLKLCGEDTDDEKQILQSLNMVLLALDEDMQKSAKLLTDYNVLPALAKILKASPTCAEKAAQVLAELAKNEETRRLCIDAGLVLALVPLLESSDQEILLHAGRAIGRICYENNDLQEQLVELDVISSLVRILTDFPDNDTLVRVDLLALSNLADLESAKEALSKTTVVGQLVKQLKKAESHERVEIIIEVLQMLAENDALKLQLVDSCVQEILCSILQRLQESSQAEDMCTMKSSSDLIVSLLLGDESMQKLFDSGRGIVYQNIPSWLTSRHTLLQMTGALAIANFARNDSNCVRMVQLGVVHQLLDLLELHVENGDVAVQHAALSALRNLAIPVMNKVQMLAEGVADRIQMLLRSEMPPVQFKLLGTLRMLTDGQADTARILGQDSKLLNRLVQWCEAKDHTGVRGEANRLLASLLRHSKSQDVVKAVQQAEGMKHLVSMTTSEHAIMQNEALIALAIASAINLAIVEETFKESELVSILQKILEDEAMGPEVKYNSLGLLCSIVDSDELRKEMTVVNIKETLEKLCGQINNNVAKQANTVLQILANCSQNSGHFFA